MMHETSLHKRRSRSETRKLELVEPKSTKSKYSNVDLSQTPIKVLGTSSSIVSVLALEGRERAGLGRRKTSAELISEAKTLLAVNTGNLKSSHHTSSTVGGLRLISTRRPITPREPGRVLYGKVALAGRPPSAFSLKYLQNEGNRTPLTTPLEPIKCNNSMELSTCEERKLNTPRLSQRSHSLDLDFNENDVNSNINSGNVVATTKQKIPRKLPSLEIKGAALVGIKQTEADSESSKINTSIPVLRNSNRNTEFNPTDIPISILTSRKLFTKKNDILAQSTTEKLIELLKEHTGLKDCTEETVSHINEILSELYARVYKHEKQFKRGFILGGLYGLVECSSPKVLLAVARVVLALHVTGSNLTGACKLIFKVARNEQNDQLFHDNDLMELLIDGLGRASPLDDPEACIYGYGSIRFLTSGYGQERIESLILKDANKNWSDCLDQLPRKPATAPPQGCAILNFKRELKQRYHKLSKQNSLVERLAKHGAVELMVLHLQMLNEAGAIHKLKGPPLHSLFQLSATLRALADVRQTSCSFDWDHLDDDDDALQKQQQQQMKVVPSGNIQLELACPHLIRAAEISIGEIEVQANIIRTLSVLSEDIDCCHVIVNFTARIGMLLGPCTNSSNKNVTEKQLSLLCRLGYILGNIMAKYDNARVQFYHNDVAMEYLLNVLSHYSKTPLTTHYHVGGDTAIDVLIKMIRVIANMSVNSEVGFGLGNASALGSLLQHILQMTNESGNVHMKADIHELTQATLGALHNLCFYQDKNSTPAQVIESKGSLQSVLNELAVTLCKTLKSTPNADTKVETLRVLGNLTRNELARKSFCQSDGLMIIIKNLSKSTAASMDHQDYASKACSIGIIVNLLGDRNNRVPFMHLKGGQLLIDLLRNALKQNDWFVAAVTCQAFWNLLIDNSSSDIFDLCDEQMFDDISDLLAEYLDEELIFENCDTPDNLWEEFAVVATDLLERLQSTYEQKQNDNNDDFNHFNKNNEDNNANDENDEDDVYIDEI